MQFFFPETAALIDWERPHEFLDKEFQKIARESEQGRKYADKLVKVWHLDGEELWLLIHVEIQAKPEDIFPQRMFTYNLRIFDKFAIPVISLAILCDTDSNWRPNQYSYNYPNTKLYFEFGTVKLLDYQNRWTELENSDNPFAIVVMAHLKMQETGKKLTDRKVWKFSLIRRLYELGLEEQDIRNLYRFIDWVMILSKELEAEFWEEYKQFEEQCVARVPRVVATAEQELTMSYITTGERIGYERGQQELVLQLLHKRVGELPEEIIEEITTLPVGKLKALGEALLDFVDLDELLRWLRANRTV